MLMRRFLLIVNVIAFMLGISVSSLSQSVKSEKELAKLERKYNKILLDLQESEKLDNDYLKACKKMLKLSEDNYTPAQIFIGDYYWKKNQIRNYTTWYVKAAENGDTTAQFALGFNYYKGNGLEKNYTNAIYWLTKVAERGNIDAQSYLWDCYSAEGAQRDTVKAIYWLTKVAEMVIHAHSVNWESFTPKAYMLRKTRQRPYIGLLRPLSKVTSWHKAR